MQSSRTAAVDRQYRFHTMITPAGALTTKRMETVDEELLDRTRKFIASAAQAKEPIFAWFNPSRMHI